MNNKNAICTGQTADTRSTRWRARCWHASLTRTPTQTLADQLSGRFAKRIHNRLLPPATRLPPVRTCAQQQGVSPHTVVAAYDRLLAQGLVEARRQR